jgi:hypothetical protein
MIIISFTTLTKNKVNGLKASLVAMSILLYLLHQIEFKYDIPQDSIVALATPLREWCQP